MDSHPRAVVLIESLHARRQRDVLNQLGRLLGDQTDAEDAAQIVWAKVSRGIVAFRGDAAVDTWLFRITHNVGLDVLRRRRARSRAEHPLDEGMAVLIPDPARSPLDNLLLKERWNRLRGPLARLSRRERHALLAEAFHDTQRQAAAALAIPIGTLKTRVHRAKAKFRTDLQ